jgi:hypothetical protein
MPVALNNKLGFMLFSNIFNSVISFKLLPSVFEIVTTSKDSLVATFINACASMPYFPSSSILFFVSISNRYCNSMLQVANFCQRSVAHIGNDVHLPHSVSIELSNSQYIWFISNFHSSGRWHDFCFISPSFPMDVGFPTVLTCISRLIFATNLF